MKIGKYNIYTLDTEKFKLDGGAMFGVVPKPLWTKTNPSDELNRVQLAATCLLLVSDTKKILVDTGVGRKWDDKSRKIYDMSDTENTLLNSLSAYNLKAGDITDVILTHLHFDHTGGSVDMQNGKPVPAFPNAKYYVQKKNFDWAMNPSERDRRSYLQENFLPLYDEGILNFTNGESQFDDNIEFIPVNGHTFAQQLVKISDGAQTLLHTGDLVPFSSHLTLTYIMGFDLQPLVTLEEKKRILKRAADEDWTLFFEHDPLINFANIGVDKGGYAVREKIESHGRS